MIICIQILYTKGWTELAKIVVPNAVNYCRKHGYAWNIQCIEDPYDGFEKLRQIKKIFEAGEADVVVSMDCDSLITNHNIKVENLLDDKNILFISKDYFNVNAGVFIVQKIEGVEKVLDILIQSKNEDIHYCEQNAIIEYMEWMQHASKVKILPQQSINSYLYNQYPEVPERTHEEGNWENGDFVLHLPGMTLEKRIEIFKTIEPVL